MKSIIEKIECNGSFLNVTVSFIDTTQNCVSETIVIPLHFGDSKGEYRDIIEFTLDEIRSIIVSEMNNYSAIKNYKIKAEDILEIGFNMFSSKEAISIKENTKLEAATIETIETEKEKPE